MILSPLLPIQLYTASVCFFAAPTDSIDLALLIVSGSQTKVLSSCLYQSELETMIVSNRPGPIQLDTGLKVLPNFVLPNAPTPKYLVVDTQLDPLPDLLIAYIRACLLNGGAVFMVGTHLSESVSSMRLRPGQKISRVDAGQLQDRLQEAIIQIANERPD